jgi:hypothetical protein
MDQNPYESPKSKSNEPVDDPLVVSMGRFLVCTIAVVYALCFSIYVAFRIMCG